MDDEEEDFRVWNEYTHYREHLGMLCDTETGEGLYGHPGCRLRGWVLSSWDTWERCPNHWHGQPHPESFEEEETPPQETPPHYSQGPRVDISLAPRDDDEELPF